MPKAEEQDGMKIYGTLGLTLADSQGGQVAF
jgi:hypothetical protein